MAYFATGAALTAALEALPLSLKGTYKAFDPVFYAAKYMGNYFGTLTPIEFFVQIGAARGHMPNADFDPVYYQSQYADLASQSNLDAADLLYHYVAYGLNEGRAGNATLAAYDWQAYLDAYQDVDAYVTANVADFGGSKINGAIAHYVKFGAQQGFTLPTPPVLPVGQTFQLTAGIDNIAGGAGDDTINASENATTGAGRLFGPLDVVDGGDGRDTLNAADTLTAAANAFNFGGATIRNVEVINVATSGTFAGLNISGIQGLETFNGRSTATAASSLTAGDATDVNLTLATTAASTVTGGKAVSVTKTAAGGTLTVAGKALTAVSVSGSDAAVTGAVTINNRNAADTANTGETLTTVSLTNVNANSTISGNAVSTLNLTGATTAARTVTVNNATVGHTLTVNVDGYAAGAAGATANDVVDVAAKTINVNANGAASNVRLGQTGGTVEATTLVNIAGAADLRLVVNLLNNLETVDGSTATGDLTVETGGGGVANISTIKTGFGDDTFTIRTTTVADDPATAANEAVNALAESGSGDDTITVSTSGAGKTTVDAGEGDDTVNVTARSTGVLTVNLGAGNDSFTSTQAINATDVIDGGEGVDTLLLSLVGAANIGAFRNFDVFDVVGLGKTLDVDILAQNNVVTEFVGSGSAGSGATLINIGAGIGFRATGNMGTGGGDELTLTQKTAGALTITMDADETGDADTAIDTSSARINATNATSLNVVFDADYYDSITGETSSGDNVTTLHLGGVATSLSIVSGGDNAKNVLRYTDTGNKMAAVTISGAQALTLDGASSWGSNLATINAAAHTGGLTASLAVLKDGGSLTLGSGKDVITVTNASTAAGIESIISFEKADAVAVSSAAGDAEAKAAAIAATDLLVFSTTAVADAITVIGGVVTGTTGVLSFTGAGPATLAAAIAIADNAADAIGEALVFQYLNDSYVFVQGVTDTVVKLVGITGVTNLVEIGSSDQFFIV